MQFTDFSLKRHMPTMRNVAFTLCVGALGGTLFWMAGIPAAWLTGAMVAVAAVAISGRGQAIPIQLRDIAFIFLGVSMGAGVSPETLDNMARWPISIVMLIAVQPFVIGLVSLYLVRGAGWDRSTALFSAIPGALSYAVAMADRYRADMRKVAIGQTVRLFVLVATLPSLITFIGGAAAGAKIDAAPGVFPALMQLAAGAVGGLLFRRLNVPAATLIGAFAASALLHGLGVLTGRLPDYLLIPGMIIIGTMMGNRFSGTPAKALLTYLRPALVALAIAMALNAAAAVIVSRLLDLSIAQTLLAFSPGGLDAMTVMAFALELDPAFVATHHLARFVMLIIVLPFIAARFLTREPHD